MRSLLSHLLHTTHRESMKVFVYVRLYAVVVFVMAAVVWTQCLFKIYLTDFGQILTTPHWKTKKHSLAKFSIYYNICSVFCLYLKTGLWTPSPRGIISKSRFEKHTTMILHWVFWHNRFRGLGSVLNDGNVSNPIFSNVVQPQLTDRFQRILCNKSKLVNCCSLEARI